MRRRDFLGIARGVAASVIARCGLSAVRAEGDWQMGPFTRPGDGQPILRPSPEAVFFDPIANRPVHWEATHVFNPAAIAWRGKLYVLYRAEDTTGHGIGQYTSRVGLAESSDGAHFTAQPRPVVYPAPGEWQKYEWPGGCEDPRIVQSEDGSFVLTFTMWDRRTARLGVATSNDLHEWRHYGPAFRRAYDGRFLNAWSKSGAIVTRKSGDQIFAARAGGKYWMYWQTDDETALAWSHDLIDWTPVLDRAGNLMIVLPKNLVGHFDSLLTEPGPPALLTPHGILLLYNGMSDGRMLSGPRIPVRQYSAGQALFAGDDPARLLQRTAEPFFWPEESWEKTGQYKEGTTFIEGLAWFRERWFLFYGAADTCVGMAVAI